MANKKNIYPVPKFKTVEEEDRYWRTHSPLLEGYEGKAQKKKQKRESFLSIRLTGEQLTQLREAAAHYGSGPSTYARQLIIQGMELKSPSLLPDIFNTLCQQVNYVSGEQKQEYVERLMEIVKRYLEVQENLAPQIAELHSISHKSDEVTRLHNQITRY